MKFLQAKVQFSSGPASCKVYEYRTVIEDLVEGDMVIVASSNGLGIARFIGYGKKSATATAWIVQRIDVDNFTKMVEMYKEISAIQEALELRCSEVSKMKVYEQLASEDESMAALLTKLKSLTGE